MAVVLPRAAALAADGVPADRPRLLANAPMEVRGDWPGERPEEVLKVLTRVRDVSLAGLRLVSDRQPSTIRIEARAEGYPMTVFNTEPGHLALIQLVVRPRDWSQMAYEFGHELGHVLCNTWGLSAMPPEPCRWLEEALVEAFSIRNLGLLADNWALDPPLPGEATFAASIRRYRGWQIEPYKRLAVQAGAGKDLGAWFRARRPMLEKPLGIGGPAREAVPALIDAYDADPAAIEALGALNTWTGGTGLTLAAYFDRWERSCADLGASPSLPRRLRARMRV